MRVIATSVIAACGGSDALTCELLADPENCWATAAAELAACMPGRATPAVELRSAIRVRR